MLPVWCRLWGLFLSTPSARRATFCGGSGGSGWPISIHALREEGDAYEPFHLREKIEISIHALREEGDDVLPVWCRLWGLFLSTPSARRATFCGGSGGSGWPISIHALREEGDAYEPFHLREKIEISIHALREEGDECREHAGRNQCISIHALREEGDQRQPCIVAKLLYFYPRPPRGGRPSGGFAMGYVTKFLSTPSARRATCFS